MGICTGLATGSDKLIKRKNERKKLIKNLRKGCIPALIFIFVIEILLAVIDIPFRKMEIHCFIGIIGGIIIARVQRHLYRGKSFPLFEYNSLKVNLMQSLVVLAPCLAILYLFNIEFFIFWLVPGLTAGYVIARDVYWWYAHLFLYDQPPRWRRFP